VARNRARWRVFNRTANQAVRLLLRSPLHSFVSRQLALITVTGRRSGREFTIPVSYHQDGSERVRINVGWPDQKLWWRNLRGEGARVRLSIRGANREGHAVARGDERTGVTVDVQLDAIGKP
jgi:F420H(2)-dependent quinone reductase